MRWLFVFAVLLAAPATLFAENRTSEKPLTRGSIAEGLSSPLNSPTLRPIAFRQIIRSSAMIFAGTVLRVDHLRVDPGSSVEITQISFRVETAIRGTRPQQVIQIREWGAFGMPANATHLGRTWCCFYIPTASWVSRVQSAVRQGDLKWTRRGG
jgi:hypothetical protein